MINRLEGRLSFNILICTIGSIKKLLVELIASLGVEGHDTGEGEGPPGGREAMR
jgi:hypothetical protein